MKIEYSDIALIWLKGHEILGKDPRLWRADDFGNWMFFPDYGDRRSPWGWEKDHRHPTSLGGLDVYANYRPLHHRANSRLGGILGALLGHVSKPDHEIK